MENRGSSHDAFIRIGLAILLLDQLVVDGWNAVHPASFCRYFPTVDLTPPFSEHHARDFGEATLGTAVIILIALIRPRAHFVIPAMLAYSVFSVPHFFFHLTHLEMATTGQAIFLTGANATVALLGIAIMLVTITRGRAKPVTGPDGVDSRRARHR
ncbi:hypothetical protein [Microlunatus soli]|uniref:DoxX-like family protein n=1 Tax=Microlunatus soli TaxID=630515 RepID=A0A1H1Q717_9ACTN|nr:hypothetical protein [Microlunatus soli]SDS19113.1 hypothetical protein SAMN04489812_1159 [Microlunatus soli]